MSLLSNSPSPSGQRKVRSSAGFTMVEVLTAMTISTIVLAGIVPFFLSNFRYLYAGEQKLLINSDIRHLTNELVETARSSNYFVLYESFYPQSLGGNDVKRDFNGSSVVNLGDRMQAGQEGSFIVFVFYKDPYFDSRLYDGIATNNPAIMTVVVDRIVGYWAAENRDISGEIAMYSFDTNDYRTSGAASWTTPWGNTFPVTMSTTATVETLIPPNTAEWAAQSSFDIIVNDMEGLTSGGLMFENFQNRSALVRTKILHGNQAKRVTNTYNFTITPRG
jgi:prepilin-type N-terminal cleavage/methylation domain-containing protein